MYHGNTTIKTLPYLEIDPDTEAIAVATTMDPADTVDRNQPGAVLLLRVADNPCNFFLVEHLGNPWKRVLDYDNTSGIQ